MGLSAAIAPTGGGACKNSVTSAATRQRVDFSTGPEIGACEPVCKCFPARHPPEGRSEGVALVGVIFGQNEGRRKNSPVKVVGDKVLHRWFGFCEAS